MAASAHIETAVALADVALNVIFRVQATATILATVVMAIALAAAVPTNHRPFARAAFTYRRARYLIAA
jgi:hypothetical protein